MGVRAHESATRAEYEYENYGKKQKGQYSHNSILEWTSAEIWLCIYANNMLINETYKKGNARAGCLLCPMSGGTSDYMRLKSYAAEIDGCIDIVKKTYDGLKWKSKNCDSYIISGAWSARKNGRELTNNSFRCIERTTNGDLVIEVINPFSDWMEWIKTLGNLKENNGKYSISFNFETIRLSIKS